MLMLLLMISTGCDVNIPGCGKRSLPFFKTVVSSAPNTATTQTASQPVNPSSMPAAKPAVSTSSKPAADTIAAATPTPLPVEKIAYTTIEKGQPTLWTMNTDGKERIRITEIGTSSWFPLWSPSGKILAFLSTGKSGKVNLYTYQKDTGGVTQLTEWDDMAVPAPRSLKPSFTWSPKSDEIAYIYRHQVWKYEFSNEEQTTITTVDPSCSITSIAWAPHRDNKFLVFSVKRGVDYYSVMAVNPRLKDSVTLVDIHRPVLDLSWTPDADHVAYMVDSKDIYTVSIHDSVAKAVILSASPEMGALVSYSPVESSSVQLLTLAKQTLDDKGYRVAVVDKAAKTDQDTGTLKYLTEQGVINATWSPDASKIAYVNSSGELWVMDALTGGSKKRLAATGIQSPDWSKK